ncbi:PhnD/SsuA/transferrin family substrate-binding protein [Umezakia ovalisporum]|uniref:PhnD/SsuA/transferrin family substrate-binding protein n=1 Tax=Umezakia ovalisporum TaxID=75695 RepID=UPI0035BA20D1
MASNFDFLQNHHPELFHSAREAEQLAYTTPRASCFHSRFTLEQAVLWIYDHDPNLRIPRNNSLSALIHERTFRNNLNPGLFPKIRIIHQVGNNAVHESTPILRRDAILLVEELFHFLYWLSRSYSPDIRNHPSVNFDENLIPRPIAPTQDISPRELQTLEKKLSLEKERRRIAEVRQKQTQQELEKVKDQLAELKNNNQAIPDTHDYNEAQTRGYMDTLPEDDKPGWVYIVMTVLALLFCGGIAIVIFQGIKNSSPIPTFLIGNKNKGLEAKKLTLGILSPPEYYQGLSDYLKEELNDKVEIIIDGNKATSYEEARKKMISKEWDIAFTMSPILSVAAKNNNYHFAVRMFPDLPAYYQAVLFTKADSPIESIYDLKSTHTIAMGDFNSASSFYVASYDLYGKTLNVNMGNRSSDIAKLVKTGQVDLGAAAYSRVEDDKNLKVIHVSKQIPSGNVYLSPNLSKSDRQIITNLLLNAPDEIKKDANYGPGEEHDYSELIKISARTEEILKCSDFTNNPVKFYCVDKPAETPSKPQSKSSEISGKINGWTKRGTNHSFKLAGDDNKIYEVIIPEPIFNQIPDAPSPIALQRQSIKIIGVIPEQEGNILKITSPSQFVVMKYQ